MPQIAIPLDLDLRALPAHGCEVAVELDLPLLLAHTGADHPERLEGLTARLPDGRTCPAHYGAGELVLDLPAHACAADELQVLLTVGGEEKRAGAPPRVVFSQNAATVEIWQAGNHWATYRYNTADPDVPRPYFHPIQGAGGEPVTQDGEFPGTRKGHIWHTGLVLAHQNFTEGNNWQTGSPNYSRMRHVAFDVMESGPTHGRFTERLDWLNVKGDRVVFREVRTVTVPARDQGRRCLDVDTAITCGDQPATWNATPYHLLAIRLPDAVLVGKGGIITTSDGQVNPKDGALAAWLDYSTPAGGVGIMNHPSNPRHPTHWLNFQNQTVGPAPTHKEPYAWKPGETLRFRYRVYFHRGDVREGKVAEEYAAYSAVPQARIGAPIFL